MLYCVPVCLGDNPPSLTVTILLATVQDCVPVRPGDNAPRWEHWQLIRENF